MLSKNILGFIIKYNMFHKLLTNSIKYIYKKRSNFLLEKKTVQLAF